MSDFFSILIILGIFCVVSFRLCYHTIRSVISTKTGKEYYIKKKYRINGPATTAFHPHYQYIIPFYQKLSANDRMRFHYRIEQFLQHYEIHSKQNLLLSPADRELIAASYIKLTWGYRDFLVDTFRYVVVYPEEYYFQEANEYHEGHFNPKQKVVLLSWQAFITDYQSKDGKNLGLHEFTHAITMGLLSKKNKTVSADLFKHYSKKIVQLTNNDDYLRYLQNQHLLRQYAFQNPIELLAVLVETYFEMPEQLQKQTPELHGIIEKMLGYHQLFTEKRTDKQLF